MVSSRLVFPLLTLCLAAPLPLQAATDWGGSLRSWVFLRTDDRAPAAGRRDSGLHTLRLTHQSEPITGWRLTGHAVGTMRSPPLSHAGDLVESTGPGFLDLSGTVARGGQAELQVGIDRLVLQGNAGPIQLRAGRQAITWGTNHFWPALDLFAPFNPGQIDRDYKPGVDALRLTLPVGRFSEIEGVAAALGSSARGDGAAAILGRLHFGHFDLGLMAGHFHGDTVVGGFATTEIAGTGWRMEWSHTRSGDNGDERIDRERFWRGSIGADRMLTPTLTLTAEVAWNGFGASDASRYASLLDSDRVRRGEINALGQRHAGLAVDWEAHPLWRLGNTLLANLDDPSALWIPTLRWSTGNESELLFGARVPVGSGPRGDLRPRSEFGLAPTTLFIGFKGYFR